MQPAEALLKPGDVLAGKYRVERLLGQGGMGLVVAVTHLDLYEPRAIKIMLPTAMPDGEAVERFTREARAASLLKSDHVARVYDVGRLDNGAPFMVMEYLEGQDLSAILKRHGALPPEHAVLYVLQASEALAEAHARGIVHRDLKPANLFLTTKTDGSPCVKVLDFGISKVVGAPADYDVTKTHSILGSPHYMSPEQMHSTRAVDGRADIWSLGVILYQLVCGKLPFRGAGITEIVAKVLEGNAPPPSHVWPGNPELDRVIMRCIERDPARRYPNVAELAQALLPFAPGAGPLVDSILRVSTSLTRSSMGMPIVQVDPRFAPATPLGGSRPDLGSMPTPVRFAAGPESPPVTSPHAPPSATGAWGGTAPGHALGAARHSRALIAATFGLAVGIGALVAWTLVDTNPPPSIATAAAPPSVAVTTAPIVTAAPTPSVSSEPVATAAPTASVEPTATASAIAPIPRPMKPAKDPFGMDRK